MTETVRLLLLTPFLALAACGDGYNPTKCREAVVQDLKTADVQQVGSQQFTYVARDADGKVWFVECLSNKAEVTAKTQLFGPATHPGTPSL